MIIEFFGLSRTGKTTVKEELVAEGYKTISKASSFTKLFNFLGYLSSHPIKTIFLFKKLNSNYLKLPRFSLKAYIKMFLMRNSYLVGALSKYHRASKSKEILILDEAPIQSIFIILQKQFSKQEIFRLLSTLPKPEILIIFELPKKTREERHAKTRYPAQWINKDYAKEWLLNSEHNYELIKNILLEKNNLIKEVYLINPEKQKKKLLDILAQFAPK